MADYKVKYIVHYQVTARRYRRPEVMETKEFDTKWEAEKFLEEWIDKHWFADVGWVEQKSLTAVAHRIKHWQIGQTKRFHAILIRCGATGRDSNRLSGA